MTTEQDKPIQYSAQQLAVHDWVERGCGSTFVQARAGTGKTTLLVGACKRMTGSVAFAAYNKKIADEVKEKLQKAGVSPNAVKAGTFHSFGYAAIRSKLDKKIGRGYVDERVKRDRLVATLKVPREVETFACRLTSLAKNAAMGVFRSVQDESAWWEIVDHHDLDDSLENPSDVERGVRYAQQMLELSTEIWRDVIDFDDMIYLPLRLKMRMWQNDWVIVDEAQDTNAARRALARKMLRDGGRSVWVGDDRQAIYGFTGADADCIEKIQREFGCTVMPLTVSYRCARAVIASAQEIVPDIEAHEDAPEGAVSRQHVDELMEACKALRVDDAILCRKTAPLVETALSLIRRGVACHVEGREIGQNLEKLAKRWKVKTTAQLAEKLDDYLERETEKLLAKGRETKVAALEDRVDTLRALMVGCDTVDCVVRKLGELFADGAPTLTLSTVHKSKGREWPRVYVLGARQFMPSPWARQDWQQVQEQNLIYVARTRAREQLIEVDVPVAERGAKRRAA